MTDMCRLLPDKSVLIQGTVTHCKVPTRGIELTEPSKAGSIHGIVSVCTISARPIRANARSSVSVTVPLMSVLTIKCNSHILCDFGNAGVCQSHPYLDYIYTPVGRPISASTMRSLRWMESI
jgi:hypothetical protein